MDPKEVAKAIELAKRLPAKPPVRVIAHPAASLVAMPHIPKEPIK